jgi:phosphatidate cytidylyltransferase
MGSSAGQQPSELTLRVLSAIVMAIVAIVATVLGGWAFHLLWAGLGLLVAWEWHRLTESGFSATAFPPVAVASLAGSMFGATADWRWLPVVAVAAGLAAFLTRSPDRHWLPSGALYAAALPAAIMLCRGDEALGMVLIFWLFAVVWGTDVCAYFAGRAIGGPKLWPRVSPKKTWSGALGGLTGAVVLGAIVLAAFGQPFRWPVLAVAIVLSALSQAGDLFESSIKRRFGAKDSSQLIPGHGGFMDRLDGFIFAVAAAALLGVSKAGLADVPAGVLIW